MVRPISQAQLQNITNPYGNSLARINQTANAIVQDKQQNRLYRMQQQQHKNEYIRTNAPFIAEVIEKAPEGEAGLQFIRENLDPVVADSFEPKDLAPENRQRIMQTMNAYSQQSGGGIGKYNPGDYTPETWAQFLNHGDPSKLKRYESSLKERLANDQGLAEKVQTVETQAAASKATATEQAKANVQLKMKPQIQKAIKQAEAAAAAKGESLTDLQRAEAALPGLKEVVGKLNVLSDAATYTMTGKTFDFMAKEMGFGATKGATARARMESLVNNQVLPLLKQTFGAAFTQQEGDSLRRTLLDIDSAPEVRKATLQSFIEQKMRDIDTKKREAGIEPDTKKPTLPEGVTEDDITETMRANNMTRQQVMDRLNGR